MSMEHEYIGRYAGYNHSGRRHGGCFHDSKLKRGFANYILGQNISHTIATRGVGG